ncbi:hypothetical protein GIB67_025115 [Kingdonia uniflora]|uniref:Uncharacterized protein n=1 Tax=Kingdonia uniflora TaxID=39325 RepID=A0A7J7N7P3_9MAGN|nr:hypothetical protein GIB67_025115 [Kingdonia uniflora]
MGTDDAVGDHQLDGLNHKDVDGYDSTNVEETLCVVAITLIDVIEEYIGSSSNVSTLSRNKLLAVILPIAGAGVFLWWAGRNIVQSNCPNCGNEFQIFKSSLNDGLQLCPYCTQPFTVEGNEFIKEPGKSGSNRSTTFGQAFNGFSPTSQKGTCSSVSIVDIEAEVKDVE